MESPKCTWRRVAVCTIVYICLSGCAKKNETSAPISTVGSANDAVGSSGNIVTVESPSKLGPAPTEATFIGSEQHQVNASLEGNIVYNRSYDIIHKGSYSSNIYQVKHGDTLFYIAWITGNDYRDLAQKNNILKPYSLNVGQILQVGNETTSITSNNRWTGTVLASNVDQVNNSVIVALVPSLNKQSIKSNVTSKNNTYLKSLNKQSIEKMLPTTDNVVTKSAPVIVSSITSAVKANGKPLINAWRWPTDGKIIDTFSAAEGGNKGVDISGFRGQPILATTNGRVVYAGNALRGYGNLIIIKHNDDYLSAYAHNDRMLVREQQEVRAGQKIATMGNTGTSITRLHFEIRYKGKSVNPLYYLPQR